MSRARKYDYDKKLSHRCQSENSKKEKERREEKDKWPTKMEIGEENQVIDQNRDGCLSLLPIPAVYLISQYAGDWYSLMFASEMTMLDEWNFGVRLKNEYLTNEQKELGIEDRARFLIISNSGFYLFAKKFFWLRGLVSDIGFGLIYCRPHITFEYLKKHSVDALCRVCFSKVACPRNKSSTQNTYENTYCAKCLAHATKFKTITDVSWIDFRELCFTYFHIPKECLDLPYYRGEFTTLSQYLAPIGKNTKPESWLGIPVAYRCTEGLFFREDEVLKHIKRAKMLYEFIRYERKCNFVRDVLKDPNFYNYIKSSCNGDLCGWLSRNQMSNAHAIDDSVYKNQETIHGVLHTGFPTYKFISRDICLKLGCSSIDSIALSRPSGFDEIWEKYCLKVWKERGLEEWLLSDFHYIIHVIQKKTKILFARNTKTNGNWFLFFVENSNILDSTMDVLKL